MPVGAGTRDPGDSCTIGFLRGQLRVTVDGSPGGSPRAKPRACAYPSQIHNQPRRQALSGETEVGRIQDKLTVLTEAREKGSKCGEERSEVETRESQRARPGRLPGAALSPSAPRAALPSPPGLGQGGAGRRAGAPGPAPLSLLGPPAASRGPSPSALPAFDITARGRVRGGRGPWGRRLGAAAGGSAPSQPRASKQPGGLASRPSPSSLQSHRRCRQRPVSWGRAWEPRAECRRGAPEQLEDAPWEAGARPPLFSHRRESEVWERQALHTP